MIRLCVTTNITGLNGVRSVPWNPDPLLHCLISFVVLPVGCDENLEMIFPCCFVLFCFFLLHHCFSFCCQTVFSPERLIIRPIQNLLTDLPASLSCVAARRMLAPLCFHFPVHFSPSARGQSLLRPPSADPRGSHRPREPRLPPSPQPSPVPPAPPCR